MKILHLSSETTWRGGEQQIAYLIEESMRSGIEAFVLVRKNSPFEAWCATHEIPYYASDFGLFAHQDLSRAVNQFEPDIIHVHSSKGHSLVTKAYIASAMRTTVIVSRRVDFPLKDNPFSRFKYNLPIIKRYICVSEAIEKIVRSAIKHPDLTCTIHSGIDLGRFSNRQDKPRLRSVYEVPEDCAVIANVSAIAPHKDYFTFVDTCAEIKQRGIKARYFIIGDGPEREAIEAYVRKKGLDNELIMTGFLDHIPAILPQIDVFLITSKTEGLGTTILDAFACHVPVVATAAGGIPESVIHEKTGLLCDVGDVSALARAVCRVIEEDGLADTLTTGAKLHLQQFSKEMTAKRTFTVYEELCSGA